MGQPVNVQLKLSVKGVTDLNASIYKAKGLAGASAHGRRGAQRSAGSGAICAGRGAAGRTGD